MGDNMNVFLFSHGGSENHGCEAIVRGTKAILNDISLTLYSNCKVQDEKYGLNEIVELVDSRISHSKKSAKHILAALQVHAMHKDTYATKISVEHMLNKYKAGDIAISIGGDNYCYRGFEEYCFINEMLRKRKIKTVLWGCSIEENLIDETLKKDLCGFDVIVARECITYDCLKKIGANVVLYADPAFQLKPKKCDIVFDKAKGKVIGINISPMIMTCESGKGAAYENYFELIRHILENTDYQIALIPHVVWASNDDRKVNEKLYADFNKNERITVIGDRCAEEAKYIISQCDMFIGARTHSTIAAYSTCVPTLVVGYSVKAKGIAKDIFGTYDNYVLPVQSLENPDDLTNTFKWIESHKNEIRAHLNKFIPGYCKQGLKAGEEIKKLME